MACYSRLHCSDALFGSQFSLPRGGSITLYTALVARYKCHVLLAVLLSYDQHGVRKPLNWCRTDTSGCQSYWLLRYYVSFRKKYDDWFYGESRRNVQELGYTYNLAECEPTSYAMLAKGSQNC